MGLLLRVHSNKLSVEASEVGDKNKNIIQLCNKNKAKCLEETCEVSRTLVQIYTNKVKVEALGPTLCLLHEFLGAIAPYSFPITGLFFSVPSPSLAVYVENLSHLLCNNLIVP